MLAITNASLFSKHRPLRRSYILNKRRNLSQKLKSKGSSSGSSVTNMISLMNLNDKKTIVWDVVPEKEHMESITKLTELMTLRFTNRANLHLKYQDYQIIDLLLSLKKHMGSNLDQELHNKWVSQVRFYHHVSEVGTRGAIQLENNKQSTKSSKQSSVQRQLIKLFDFW